MIRPQRSVSQIRITRHRNGSSRTRKDVVAVEEPLEIRLIEHGPHGSTRHQVAVTMRTPGHDFELTAGFLFSEGLLSNPEDVTELSYCQGDDPQHYNIVEVRLRRGAHFDHDLLNRNFYTSSSCGVCGKASLEAVEVRGCSTLAGDGMQVDEDVVRGLPDALMTGQQVFDRTGGLHAAGLFSPSGEVHTIREDVGRHNAVDKVVGEAFLTGDLPRTGHVLAVSGRTSFEIIQKALAAGIPFVVAVGAPSSLAVDLAGQFGMTLIGFTNTSGFNIYTGKHRVRKGTRE
jgi:FdhD protein